MSNFSKKGLVLLLTMLLILVIVPSIANATGDDEIPQDSLPNLQINLTKSATPASGSTVLREDTITYKVDYNFTKLVENYAAIEFKVTDNIPANTTLIPGSITNGGTESGGVITWDIGNLQNISGSVSFSVKVNSDVADGTVINNQAGAKGYFGNEEPFDVNSNQTTHTVNVPTPVVVEKVVQPAAETPQTIKPASTEVKATETETKTQTQFPATGLPEVSNLWLISLGLLSFYGANKLKL